MRVHPANPERNCLPAGIDKSELIKAIETSGYPLQGTVASLLKQEFVIAEEWSYIDLDLKERRSLDVFAYRSLLQNCDQAVQPSLILLIECKRSRQPYVFFTCGRKSYPTISANCWFAEWPGIHP